TDDTLAVGAIGEASCAIGVGGDQTNGCLGVGAVYVFFRAGTACGPHASVKTPNLQAKDHFGVSVGLPRDTRAGGGRVAGRRAAGLGGAQTDNGSAMPGRSMSLRARARAGASRPM